MPPPIKDVDRGFDRIAKMMKKGARGISAKVGIQGEKGSQKHGTLTNAQLGTVHEFGSTINHPGGTPYRVIGGRAVFLRKGDPAATGVTGPHAIVIPERSFIRHTFDRHAKRYGRELDRVAGKALETGQLEGEMILFAEGIRGDVLKTFKSHGDGEWAPLAPATVARKKGEKTQLIDTGQLLNSISAEIEKG